MTKNTETNFSPRVNSDEGAREALFVQAIECWVAGRRENILTAKEIGGLNGFSRVAALRNAQLANIASYLRANPRADCTLGVMAFVTALADNNDGKCSLSITRLAQTLGRSYDRVRKILSSLSKNDFLLVEPNDGDTSLCTPVVHRAFSEAANIIWIVNALSTAPKGRGRPKKPRSSTMGVFQETPVVDDEHSEKPRSSMTKTPVEGGRTISLTDLPVEEAEKHISREADDFCQDRAGSSLILGEHLHAIQSSVAARCGQPVPSRRDIAERTIASDMDAYSQTYDRALVARVMGAVLSEMRCRDLAAKNPGQVLAYFHRTMDGRLRDAAHAEMLAQIDLERARASAEIKTAADRICGDMKSASLAKRLASGEDQSAARAAHGAASSLKTTAAPDRFRDSDQKIVDVHGCWVSGQDANDILDAVPGATVATVRKALLAATGEKKSRFGAGEFDKPGLTRVISWATERLRQEIAYATHGTPESLCGGVPHRDFSGKRYSTYTDTLIDRHICLSEDLVSSLHDRYPAAFRPDPTGIALDANFAMKNKFSEIAQHFDWSEYGHARQKKIETEMEQFVEQLHAAALRRDEVAA